MFTHFPKINSSIKNSTKVRSDLNIMEQILRLLKNLFLCVESSKPKAVDPTPAVVGSFTYGANHLAKVCGV